MPTAIRPREVDGNSTQGRKPFRPVTDFRQAKSNGYGNGHSSHRYVVRCFPEGVTIIRAEGIPEAVQFAAN